MESRFAVNTAFKRALDEIARDASLAAGRFPARNFLLECEIPLHRIIGYIGAAFAPARSPSGASTLAQFNAHHNRYLIRAIQLGVRSRKFDPTDSDCPESFKAGAQTREYGGTGAEVHLARVEHIQLIAHSSLWGVDEAMQLLSTVADANRRGVQLTPDQEAETRALLDAWQDTVDARPLFAAFWEEVHDSADWDVPGWANILRDGMGLAHYDASTRGPIPIVLFKYPVAVVPTGSTGSRLLLRPTVLDSSLSEAFYTGEPESGAGATVDLGMRNDDAWQEVIHPAVHFTPAQVWGVDTVTTGVSAPIADARGHHMLKVAMSTSVDFSQLCESIDGDLL